MRVRAGHVVVDPWVSRVPSGKTWELNCPVAAALRREVAQGHRDQAVHLEHQAARAALERFPHWEAYAAERRRLATLHRQRAGEITRRDWEGAACQALRSAGVI